MNARVLAVVAGWVAAVTATVVAWVVFVDSGRLPEYSGGQPIFLTVATLSAPALGTVVLRRQPREWTGPLVCAALITAMLSALRTTDLGALSQLTGVIALTTVLLPGVVAVDQPALRASHRTVRMIRWCWWSSAVGGLVVAAAAIVGGSVPRSWWSTPEPGPASAVATILLAGYSVVVLIGVAGAAVFAVSRYRSMPRGGRAALRPVVLPLVGWSAATAAATGWRVITGVGTPTAEFSEPGNTLFVVLPAVLVSVLAIGIGWIEVMVRRPAPSAVSVAADGPGQRRSRETDVERYLSRALADPSIRVLYPITSSTGGWVEEWMDGTGDVVDPDVTNPDRAVTLIRRGSTQIGLIEQDAAAAARPDAVELVATGAGLIMETERLMAAARRDLEQSRQLASRLLSASDEPRTELRAELADGPLHDLAGAAADLAGGASLTDIAQRLQRIAAQVRTISHGVFPPALTTGGIKAALPGAAAPDRRYPAPVEMTAYLVARADPYAVIEETRTDDRAALLITTALTPAVTVRDRVTAIGGSIQHADARWTITVPATG